MAYLILGIFIGVATANFGEYWVHRLLHQLKIEVHNNHHKENKSHGWISEYRTYLFPALPLIIVLTVILWILFGKLISVGWTIGVIIHIAFSAYLHELCHTKPSLIFWMKQPIHYSHHKYSNSNTSCNYSFSNTFWDKIFGTYRHDNKYQPQPFKFKELFLIKWF